MHVHHIEAGATTVDAGTPPPGLAADKRKTFKILFHDFQSIPLERGRYVRSPWFFCNGHHWSLIFYPGGSNNRATADGQVSLFLQRHSEVGTITCAYKVNVLTKFGNVWRWERWPRYGTLVASHSIDQTTMGIENFMPLHCILDESMGILDDNGTMAFIVSMKEEPTSVRPFIPENDFIKKVQAMFLDEETADLCFEVSKVDEEKERIYAHRFILTTCAPMLASLFESSAVAKRTRSSRVGIGEVATASITDVKPGIFRHLLCYLYGGSVPTKALKAHAKEITLDNLLYADAKNCALLKEAVMDFLAEHHNEAVKKVTFADVPGHLMKDLLVAFGRSKSEDKAEGMGDYDAMRVSELRSKLNEMGLDVDGSREAMIDTLKKGAKGN